MIFRTTIYPANVKGRDTSQAAVTQAFDNENEMNVKELCDILGYFHPAAPRLLESYKFKFLNALIDEDHDAFYKHIQKLCKELRTK